MSSRMSIFNETSRTRDSFSEKRKSYFKWMFAAIVITFIVCVSVAVGLYFKSIHVQKMVAQDQSSSYQGQYQNFSLTLRSEKIAVIQRQAEKVERMFKNLLQLDAKVNRLLQQQNQSFHDELEQQLEQQNHIFEVRFNRLQKNVTKIIFPDLGWFTPWNGYQYRLTGNPGTWHSVRVECQSYGADLAAFGMRNFNTRRFIKNALQNTRLWIGFNDLAREDVWVWVDGRAAKKTEKFWLTGEPSDSGNNEDCGEVGYRNDYLINDVDCNSEFYGICEKRLH